MPENTDTAEEIAARKLQSDIDFIRDQIEGNPDAAISAVSIEDSVKSKPSPPKATSASSGTASTTSPIPQLS